ncbi:MAG: hypothetical protein NTX25_09185 [Proteobacteria bacterium]|nr:hypothetical protein [Pseudomonadota bacterium]
MKARVFVIMTFLLHGVNAKASDAKPASHDAPAATPGSQKKSETKSEPSHGAAVGIIPSRSDHYVHHWFEFPKIHGIGVENQESMLVKPKLGRVTVLVFLASWCLPCQQQIRNFRQIEDKYRDRYTDFVYIFAHDTHADARGFSGVYKLGDNALIASAEVLEAFHQPELPSFYVADRYNWMIMRRIKTQSSDLKELDSFLDLHTAM